MTVAPNSPFQTGDGLGDEWNVGLRTKQGPPRLCVLLVLIALVISTSLLTAAEPVALTTDGRVKRNPVLFGSEGREVLYVVLERPSQYRLMKLDLVTKHSVPFHPDERRSEFDPDVSRDGRWLTFAQSRGNLSLALVVKDLKENRQFEVAPGGGFSGLHGPVISPDNTRVVYSFPDQGRQHLLTCNTECRDVKRLIDSEGINNWPSFSPDGRELAFSSTRDGNYELYIARSDGSSPRRLTDSPTQDIRPKWSPDGRRIAFVSNRDGNYELYVIHPDGSGLMRVTTHPEQDNHPCWDSDSQHLFFVGERAGQHDLLKIAVP
jgi:TolB protein